MLMLALDPGRRCGFAAGVAGTRPESGFYELRQKNEHRSVGEGNLLGWLDVRFRHARPDIVVYEEPLSVAAWFKSNQKREFPTNAEGVESAFQLEGVIRGICRRWGIRCEGVRRQTVLKHMTGTSKHGSRDEGKKAVISACITLQLVEAGCKDDDRCDAVANHIYASSFFARKQIENFALFGQKSD